jgi:hypothetical protein
VLAKDIRFHRLTVRTPGFHPGNPGSIPGGITKKKSHSYVGFFLCTKLVMTVVVVMVFFLRKKLDDLLREDNDPACDYSPDSF